MEESTHLGRHVQFESDRGEARTTRRRAYLAPCHPSPYASRIDKRSATGAVFVQPASVVGAQDGGFVDTVGADGAGVIHLRSKVVSFHASDGSTTPTTSTQLLCGTCTDSLPGPMRT